jgi:SAM-dependent methyltransferase
VRLLAKSFVRVKSVAGRDTAFPGAPSLPAEDIYGHLGRVHWFRTHLSRSARIIEVGCGTGYQITLPLRTWGYNIVGIDIDSQSIEYGRRLFENAGLGTEILVAEEFRSTSGEFDAVIISEVLEHLSDTEVDDLLKTAHTKLRANGVLLVTVPNGYGWFEMESFLWKKLGVGAVLTYSGVAYLARRIKGLVVRGRPYTRVAPTLSSTPHVQRFTLRGICRRIERAGFGVYDATGSVLACGPFSDMMLTGAESVMQLNRRLGSRFPTVAAGFYVAARKLERPGAA